jgi:Bacterial protein of unknown function (DUF885)
VNATFTGHHAFDERLPDWSPAGRAMCAGEVRALLDEFTANPRSSVAAMRDDVGLLDNELARANLAVRLEEHDSGFFHARNPALWTGEAIFSVVSLMIRDFAPVSQRITAIIARLNGITRFLREIPEVIREPIPAHWTARAQRECDAASGLFDRGLRDWLAESDVGAAVNHTVLEAAARARNAFAELHSWLASQHASGETSYACGERTFGILLREGQFCGHDAMLLLEQALAELPVEMDRLTQMIESRGESWAEVQNALAEDRPTVGTYYSRFTSQWDRCREIAAQHDAVTWQEWPIRYVPIPEWAQAFAPHLYWLFYRSPAPFDPYTEYEYVVTAIDASLSEVEQSRRLRAWNHSTITLNHVVHHGAIGHHVQNWHARYRSTSRIGAIAAVDCASRIGMFLGGSMAEGWACYATHLMEELGMFTELERISEQHTRVRMLARAIVDIRLHHGLCSFSDAVEYYQAVVGMSPEIATAEATKNSMFPCTALMYWLGTRTILQLRERMKSALGHEFSLRAFHDELLSRGAIPVALAATLMLEPHS